ncbi:unnamed protein product [Pylaiella littoralis]
MLQSSSQSSSKPRDMRLGHGGDHGTAEPGCYFREMVSSDRTYDGNRPNHRQGDADSGWAGGDHPGRVGMLRRNEPERATRDPAHAAGGGGGDPRRPEVGHHSCPFVQDRQHYRGTPPRCSPRSGAGYGGGGNDEGRNWIECSANAESQYDVNTRRSRHDDGGGNGDRGRGRGNHAYGDAVRGREGYSSRSDHGIQAVRVSTEGIKADSRMPLDLSGKTGSAPAAGCVDLIYLAVGGTTGVRELGCKLMLVDDTTHLNGPVSTVQGGITLKTSPTTATTTAKPVQAGGGSLTASKAVTMKHRGLLRGIGDDPTAGNDTTIAGFVRCSKMPLRETAATAVAST